MPRLKIYLPKVLYIKQYKSYFLRFYQVFVETKDAIYTLLNSKSARNPGHYRLFVSTGTRPGQMQIFRDCPGHSRTLGNYGSLSILVFEVAMLCNSAEGGNVISDRLIGLSYEGIEFVPFHDARRFRIVVIRHEGD